MDINNSYKTDNEFGDRVRLIRTLFKLTQKEVAEKIGLQSAIAIYQYEKKLRKPDRAKILLLAELGCTTSQWLLRGDVDAKICDKIVGTIKHFYTNQYPPLSLSAKVTDSLMDSLVGFDLFLEKAAKRLDVPSHYLLLVTKHDIDPSANFIRHFCQNFNVQLSEFGDALAETRATAPDEAKPETGRNEADPTTEICALLADDEEARSLVLELLRARKTMKRAIDKLRQEE
jgi:transcriptional regulator with XRE-family HTH domain